MDTSPVARTMRTFSGKAKSWADQTAKDISGSFKGAFSSIAGIISVAGVVAMAKKITDMADEVKGASEALGVSTDFIQGFRTAVSQNSGTVEQANKGLEIFSRNIGQGSENFAKWGVSMTNANGTSKTTTDLLIEVADKIKDTASGSERAAIAFDLFGKSGSALIPTLMMGGEAMKKYIEATDKLSADDLIALADAQDKIQLAIDRTTISLGGFVGGILKAKAAWDSLLTQSRESRIKKFLAELSFNPLKGGPLGAMARVLGAESVNNDIKAVKKIGDTPTAKENSDLISGMINPLKGVLDLQLKIYQILGLQNDRMKDRKVLTANKSTLSDLGKMTIGEIANNRNSLGGDRSKAQRYQSLTEQANQARLNGDQAGFMRLTNQAEGILNGNGKMSSVDSMWKASADALDAQGDTRLADMFRSRINPEFSGIKSLKDSEKQTEFKKANDAVVESAKSLAKIEKAISEVTLE